MDAHIIDRGRGPEIRGTRVTVYRIMDCLRVGDGPEQIAIELDLTLDQVRSALNYIDSHRDEVEAAYDEILARVNHPKPAWVEAKLAKTPEDLKRRLKALRPAGVRNADSSR
jgi:uncharacterized protein (DUF433 family)